jgi:hypothetical protein
LFVLVDLLENKRSIDDFRLERDEEEEDAVEAVDGRRNTFEITSILDRDVNC